jgi:dTDP-4-amino-4,6-dideoxyglucose formyltransferase
MVQIAFRVHLIRKDDRGVILAVTRVPHTKMKVPFLTGGNVSRPLVEWLGEREEVSVSGERLGADDVASLAPDVIVSHSYPHILTRDVLVATPGWFVNLHVSLLPFNRDEDPNFWSFIDDMPKGVTVHRIDQGIDVGPILLQREVSFAASGETLASTPIAGIHYARKQRVDHRPGRTRLH